MNYATRIIRMGKKLTKSQMELLALLYYGFELVMEEAYRDGYYVDMDNQRLDVTVDRSDVSFLSDNRLLELIKTGRIDRQAMKLNLLGEQVFEQSPTVLREFVLLNSLKDKGIDLITESKGSDDDVLHNQ